MSRYNSLFFLIIAGLCFGQRGDSEVDTRISLMLSRSMYTKHGFALRSSPLLGYFYDDNLMVPAESENLQPTTSLPEQQSGFCKQAGIYGLELLGAGIGMGLSYVSLPIFVGLGYEWGDIPLFSFVTGYTVANVFFTSTTTWLVGKIFGQHGSWLRASIGAGLGGLINGITIHYYINKEPTPHYYFLIFTCTLPPSGSVIGYNIR